MPIEQPRAAWQVGQAAATPLKPPKPSKALQVPLQIRIPAAAAKAIKRAALDADQTVSEFMLACFHETVKTKLYRPLNFNLHVAGLPPK